jgi:ribonuclease J
LFGAVGVAVETEAGWVAYSGDLRFHGEQGEASWAFADGLAALGVRALLCEGTRLSQPNVTTEAMVAENCLAAVREASGELVVADFAPRNVERLITFLGIAAQTGRRLVVQPKDAYLLRAMHLADPRLPDVMVQPAAGMYADPKIRAGDWEAMVRTRYRAVIAGPEDVTRSPGEYILAFSLTDVADVLDLDFLQGGIGGGVYIFSNSQAYDDEQKVDLVRLWNWTQRLGLRMVGLTPSRTDDRGRLTEVEPVPGFHASGHAGQPELVEFVRRARPEILIPIHTDAADLWVALLKGTGVKVVLPEYARPLDVGG